MKELFYYWLILKSEIFLCKNVYQSASLNRYNYRSFSSASAVSIGSSFIFHTCSLFNLLFLSSQILQRIDIAAAVGSNHPTRSTFINLVNYGIELRSISVIVGLIQQQCPTAILYYLLFLCSLF
jgi:hypothetical protein